MMLWVSPCRQRKQSTWQGIRARHSPSWHIRLAGKSDGIEAAIKLFSNYGVPSIFATAHGDAETRLRAAKANPRGWVNKPYSMDVVIAAIRSALSS